MLAGHRGTCFDKSEGGRRLMERGRWGRRLQSARWRQAMDWRRGMAQRASRIPLFRSMGQPPMQSGRAWIRQAWLLQARRALAFRRGLLDRMLERLELVDECLAAAIEEDVERARPRRRSQPGPPPEVQTPPSQPSYPPERERAPDRRRAALEAVFEEMEGHEEEFLDDGRPRVENVNTRLSARGEQVGATRREVDEAFDAWKRRRE
jgi:hypothetical protein